MAVPRPRLVFWFVLAGAAVLLFVGTNRTPLLDPDESRFAQTSVEMLDGGDLVIPRFEGHPRLVKPPLIHWVQAFLFSLLGVSESAARLHAALATLGSIALVGWIGRRRFGEEGGTWAAVVMASTPLVLVPGRIGTLDALLAVHVLAVIGLDLIESDEDDPYRAPLLGALLGLAFLTKGPVGVLLPLLVMLAGRTAARREVVPSLRAVSRGLAGWCVVVLPWGLAFLRRIGAGSTVDLIRGEVLDRYFAGTTHVEPPWFYAKVVGVGLLPWVAPLSLAMVRSWRLRRSPVAGTALYAAGGLVAGLVFFSLGQGKEANYILPLVPLAALLVTWELARELEAPSKLTLGPILLTATALAATLILALAAGLRFQGAPRVVAIVGSVAFGVAAVVAGVGTFRHRPRMVYASVAAATAATFLGAVLVLLPAIGERKSAAPLIDAVPVLRSGRPLVTVEIRVPSLTFYLRRPAEVLDMTALATRIAAADDPLFVLADVDADDIPADLVPRLRELGRHGKFLVYEKR